MGLDPNTDAEALGRPMFKQALGRSIRQKSQAPARLSGLLKIEGRGLQVQWDRWVKACFDLRPKCILQGLRGFRPESFQCEIGLAPSYRPLSPTALMKL